MNKTEKKSDENEINIKPKKIQNEKEKSEIIRILYKKEKSRN